MKFRRAALLALLPLLGAVAGFCALEGTSSLILFVGKIVTFRAPSFQERLHTVYDRELGWVNRPGVVVPDMYGPGVRLTTNAQGFRAVRDTPREAPKDRVRVICAGDSFTLGYGVGDEQPWCARLAARDPHLDTVNMGQGGYGVDQAYLWYERDGEPIEHSALVFALITGDFERMKLTTFAGHGKPILALEGDRLVTRNVPVPPPSRFPFLWRRFAFAAGELRFAQLVQRIRSRSAAAVDPFDESTWGVAAKLFESLARSAREHHRTFVVLYLPTRDDHDTTASDGYREHLQVLANAGGFTVVDLVPVLRELPALTMRSLFIPDGSEGAGHYAAAGHEWVAEQLAEALRRIPPFRAALESVGARGDR